MIALDIRDCFSGPLYGPDLVQAHKAGPKYYERILADRSVVPSDALFVDDNPKAVGWAAETGATAVHMCRNGDAAPDAHHVVGDLHQLAGLLETL